jgi:hypothetical protein
MVASDPQQDRFGARARRIRLGLTRCSVLSESGELFASGEAHIDRDDSHVVATVQGLTSVGALMLAIFGRGQKRFTLDLPDYGPLQVELAASSWLAGKRVCFFRSLQPVLASATRSS